MDLSKKRILLYLIIIGSISIILKLLLVDFSLPVIKNDLDFALRAMAYNNGEFAVNPKQNPGWPLFVSVFYRLFESNHFIDYSNVIRLLSIGISTISIIPMYLISRKFFDEKYSIVAASLFAFEPHINYRAGWGLTEPLYILAVIMSVYFILNKNNKLVYLSFIFAATAWWIRLDGILMFFVISVIFFVNYKKTPKLVIKYLACIAIFAIIVSPFLIQRYNQYDDPFYFYYNDHLFVEDYQTQLGVVPGATASSYVEDKGIGAFVDRFIVTGVSNMIEQTARLSVPYLFFLLPFGALFSLRAFDQEKAYIKANWLVILIYAALLVIPFAVINERRFLFLLFPFLIIFSVIAVQRVTEYGLGTFSFSQKQKNIFLIIFLFIVVLLSGLFMLRYEIPDSTEAHEEMELANFLANDINGIIMLDHRDFHTGYLSIAKLESTPNFTKEVKINRERTPNLGYPHTTGNTIVYFEGKSFEDTIHHGKNTGAKYILVMENNSGFPFLDDIYVNENNYPLRKVFDSSNMAFKKLNAKVFQIDYDKFSP